MRFRRGRNFHPRGGRCFLFGKIEKLEGRLLLASAVYNWQNVAIGAGGFVDGIFYDPNNANTIYARTDIGGLYKTTDDGTTWQQLLDFVGNNASTSGNSTQQQEIGVLSFAIDPENSNNLYADVGEYSGTNGDVFYSTNAGQTWSTTALSFYVGGNSNGRGDGEQIAVDPNDSNIILLGSNNAGLWESTNAGHSFSRISGNVSGHSSGLSTSISTTFVLFDPIGTAGNPSQTIYLGANSTSSGTNLYKSTNGGSSWSQVTIASGSGPTGFLPGHAVLSGGNLYLGYANAEAPNGSITNGGVYRYTPSTGVWASISPKATSGSFGYDAVAADPQNPNTVVVTSFDYYAGPDQIWRTVNANATTPTWTEIYDYAAQQNYGYGGYNTTRNSSTAPYVEASGDGISNWVATVAINPFNSNQLMYGTGQGIWATNNASNSGANTQLTAANNWYFPDTGIEFTAVGGLATAASGVPLFSAMGDIFGFAHTTLTSSPAQGDAAPFGSANAVDAADNVIAIVGSPDSSSGTYYGVYSTNDGATFQNFPTSPGTGNTYGTDTVAVSANGSSIVWSQTGLAPYYSTNDGTTWTASTGGMAANGQIVADRMNANDFYYHVGTDIYFSNNAGASFILETTSAPSDGDLVANPFTAGDLWIAASGGLYHSTNFGSSFTKVTSTLLSTNSVMTLGAPTPGQTVPAIYVFGTIAGFLGIYRSDDGGSTWTQLNDTAHQWGGLIQTLAADPNVFGRVYIGINGRGIIMGNPATSLPSGWSDTDINTPGNPGWATSSTTLSTGTTINQWTINGGGAGVTGSNWSVSTLSSTTLSTGAVVAKVVTSIASGLHVGDPVTISGATPAAYNGTYAVSVIVNSTTFEYAVTPHLAAATGTITASTNDQFNFAYQPITGDGFVTAELSSLTNADGTAGTPHAGVMFRSSTDDNDPFVALLQTSGSQLIFEYRSTTGSSVSTTALGSIPIGGEYLELTRAGNVFTAYYSGNGSQWTQLGSPITIAAMPTTANAGVAVSAGFNSQLASAAFSNVSISAPPSPSSVQLNSVNQLVYAFGSNASPFLSQSSLSVTPLVGGSAISTSGFSYNSTTNTATFVLPSPITPGIYQASLFDQTFVFLATSNSSTFSLPGSEQTYIVQQLFLAANSTLDVGDNTLNVQYAGASPAASIAAEIAGGYDNGLWNAPGIFSSDAAADASATTGVGYFDTGSQVTIRDTWFGDANLDGTINADDLSLIALGQTSTGTRWQDGNFNYDTHVDADDWSKFDYVLAYSRGQSMPAIVISPATEDDTSSLLVSPDPI